MSIYISLMKTCSKPMASNYKLGLSLYSCLDHSIISMSCVSSLMSAGEVGNLGSLSY